jgi:ketosteroid isomerase-like protein
MPRRLSPLVPVLSLLLLAALAPPGRADEEQDHEALRQLRAVYEQAVNENRLELLAPHLDASFTGVMLTGDQVSGFDGLKAYWAKIRDLMGPGGRYTVKLNPDLSLLFGDVALAKGTTEDVVVTDAGEYRFSGHWTAVLQRKDGAWKVVRAQGSMDPIGNPFVKKGMSRVGLVGGGAGIVLGGLAGVFAGMALGRRRAAAAGGSV